MELARIERYVSDLMTVSGVDREGKEQSVGLALYHLLMSAALRDLMDDDEKELFKALAKKVQYFFCTKLSLKERKETKKKKDFPPHPLLKEKDKKETEEKNPLPREAGLEERRKAFYQECMKRKEFYSDRLISKFYNEFSQVNKDTGKMKFEEEKYWDIDNRLEKWSTNSFAISDELAALRLQKQKKLGDAHERQQAAAQERTDANDRLEQEIAERKKKAITYKEWLALKEKNNDNQDNS